MSDVEARDEIHLNIFGSGLLAVFTWDFQGNVLDANDTFLELIGYSREELRAGKVRWADLTPPEFKELDERGCQQVRSLGRCPPFEKEYIHKSGRRIPILIGAVKSRDSKEGGTAFVIDMSVYKEGLAARDRAHIDSEVRYRAITMHSDDVIWDWDVLNHDVVFERRFFDVFSYDASLHVTTLDWWESRIHPEDRPIVHDTLRRFPL